MTKTDTANCCEGVSTIESSLEDRDPSQWCDSLQTATGVSHHDTISKPCLYWLMGRLLGSNAAARRINIGGRGWRGAWGTDNSAKERGLKQESVKHTAFPSVTGSHDSRRSGHDANKHCSMHSMRFRSEERW